MKQTKKEKNVNNQRSIMIAVAVTPKLKTAVDKFASTNDVSRSEALRQLIGLGLVA